MTKKLTIHNQEDIEKYRDIIIGSVSDIQISLCEMAENAEAMELFYSMKFEEIGCDPFDATRKLNLIEQINQTFTYLASLKAAEYLLNHHPNLESLTLNIGTRSGHDIETSEIGGVAAEVFAAVHPNNNRKLEKDIERRQYKECQRVLRIR